MTAEALLGIRPKRAGEQIRKGLPYKTLQKFSRQIGLSTREITDVFDMPLRTIQRRKEAGKLNKEESNGLYRAARVFAAAIGFFEGDIEAARGWIREEVPALGNRRPIDMLDTDADAQLVLVTLARLEDGIIT